MAEFVYDLELNYLIGKDRYSSARMAGAAFSNPVAKGDNLEALIKDETGGVVRVTLGLVESVSHTAGFTDHAARSLAVVRRDEFDETLLRYVNQYWD